MRPSFGILLALACGLIAPMSRAGSPASSSQGTAAAGTDRSAREIAERAEAARRPAALRQKATMTLFDPGGPATGRARTLLLSRRERPASNGSDTRLDLLAPKEVAGTVLLTRAERGESTQHLYLPGLRRVRRITGGQRSGAFLGSDFSYEDLSVRDLDHASWKRLPDETLDGRPCYVIEATPVAGEPSAYGRTVAYVTREDYFTVQVRYFDRNGIETKRLAVDPARVKRNGSIVVPLRLEMTNRIDGHRTVIDVESADLAPTFDDSLFDPARLDKG